MRLLDVVLDDLREVGGQARDHLELRGHVGDQRLFGRKARGIERLQVGHDLDVVGTLRIGAVVGPPDVRDDVVDLGIRVQHVAHEARDFLGLVDRRRWREGDGEPDVALVQLGQEFAAEPRRQQHRDREREHRHQHYHAAVQLRPFEQGHVALRGRFHPPRVLFREIPPLERVAQERRDQREREKNRPQQREAQGVCHRREDLSFHALEREDRQEGENDDELGEDDRRTQADGGIA